MTSAGGGGRELLAGLHLAWVRSSDLPQGVAWLTPAEQEVLGRLVVEKRRADWRLGRWAAKLAVRALLGDERAEVEVLAGEDGRPRVRGVSLSISHVAGVGFAAAGRAPGGLGCDVEAIEPRSDGFVADYFTEAERAAVHGSHHHDHALMANLVWSAKESALKALGEGLRLDTRSVEVDTAALRMSGSAWSPLVVTGAGGRIFRGHWRVRDGLVWTVLTGVAS